LKRLVDTLKGDTVYILGAGPSMDSIPHEFFKWKITIGINGVFEKFPCIYSVMKHNEFLAKAKGKTVRIASEYDRGVQGGKTNTAEHIFKTIEPHIVQEPFKHIKMQILDDERITTGYSTVISAIDIARKMGAKMIILCGIDCEFSGSPNYDGYYRETPIDAVKYKQLLEITKDQIKTFSNHLKGKGISLFYLKQA
jgi:hypothetical protein